MALAAIIAVCSCRADATDPSAPQKGAFFYPSGPGAGRLRVVLGASLDVLPRRLVESEQRHVPHLTAGVRWGLPYAFSLDARASAIVLSNEAQAGLSWSAGSDRFAFDVHARTGAWFGTIGVEGFDATGFGILSTPGLTFGVPMRELRFSLGLDALIVQAQSITVGDSTLRRNKLLLEGIAVPLVVESVLPRGGAFYYGVTLIWARPDYQLWLAFSDSRARQLYPRFVAGYEF